jgi:hypothetical protein
MGLLTWLGLMNLSDKQLKILLYIGLIILIPILISMLFFYDANFEIKICNIIGVVVVIIVVCYILITLKK